MANFGGGELDRRTARWFLGLTLLLSLGLNAFPLWWGLPDRHGWAFDEIVPLQVAEGIEHGFMGGWATRYPPLHYYVLAVVYLPIRLLVASGLATPEPWEVMYWQFLAGRALSVLMATATVYLVYRIGRRLHGRAEACLAALGWALTVPFVYYAKTVNLEVPYLFWFALALLAYLRILKHQQLRDYLWLSAAVALSICSKDQAWALFAATPILLLAVLYAHRRRHEQPPPSLPRVILDRRLVAGFVLSVSLFALIHRIPFDPRGLSRHVDLMIAISRPAVEHANTLAGHAGMAWQSVRNLEFAIGTPLLVAALGGLLMALRKPVRNLDLLSLLSFVVSYYVLFIGYVRYSYVRFLLPVGLVALFFAAPALSALLTGRWLPRSFGRLLLVAVFGVAMIRALTVDLSMLVDARYAAEEWLEPRIRQGESVLGLGYRELLPRGLETLEWGRFARVRWRDPDYLVVNELAPWGPRERASYERVLAGELPYRLVKRFAGEPALRLRGISRVRTNLDTLNPSIAVFRRAGAWGPTVEQVIEELESLRERPDAARRARLVDELLTTPMPERQSLWGDQLFGIGLTPDRWTSATWPALLAVANPGMEDLSLVLLITALGPVEVLIEDGAGERKVVFESAGRRKVHLAPLAPGAREVYLIAADRAFGRPSDPKRQVGVRLDAWPVDAARRDRPPRP